VEITLTEANSDRLVEALRAGQLQMALIGLAATTPAGIEIHVVANEPLVAAVSPGDALAARKTITLAAMRDRPLISLPRGTGLRSRLDDACATAGFQPHIAFEASDPQVLAQLAARGLGLAILPESVACTHPRELHAIPITRPQMRGRLALAWRAEGPISPAARALISRARVVLPRPSDDPQPAA
jgi:DNA-binding transcriptional LysR family regulator